MNYPNKKVIDNSSFIQYGKRGMTLENDINLSNKYYLDNDIAVIYKKPTPIKVVKVDYNKRINTKIVEAYYEVPSTTDYNGIYKGKYIDFEAKETNSTTSFPLSNIHKHQLLHLENIERHGGIAFIIVRFQHLGETYVLFEKDIKFFLDNYNRKSIPLNYFKDKGYLVKDKFNPRVDYLEILDNIGGTHEKKN